MPQTKDIRHWQLRRENQDSIFITDTHGTYAELVARFNGELIYGNPDLVPDYVKEAVVKMFRVNHTQLVGYYHEHGYNIWRQIDGKLSGEALYTAGNSRCDSTNLVPVERGEDLETLHRFCTQTGNEMAEELGIPWGGCDREDDPYDGQFDD
jgi:hypothetical protein